MKNIFQKVSVCVLTHLIGQKTWFVMEMHSRGTKRLALTGWAGWTLSASREPLSLTRTSIADTFENAAITLARWAIESLMKREVR